MKSKKRRRKARGYQEAVRRRAAAGASLRRRLLSRNFEQVIESWEIARKEEPDPVVFVLDLRDAVAAELAVACGLPAARVREACSEMRGRAIPTAVVCLSRPEAASFARESSPETQIARHLASGRTDSAIDVVVVAEAGNTFVRLPFKRPALARG